jgi:polygalacturonase
MLMVLAVVFTYMASAIFAGETSADVPYEIAPIQAPFEMPQLKRPMFADRTFNIVDYGAKGDGTTINTEAFRKAITACNSAGGGKVLVPAGKWLTGAIHLKSNVHLYLAEGAIVYFPSDLELYLPVVHDRIMGVECYNYSPFIYAPHAENIAITGKGTLEADGYWWYQWAQEHRHGTRQGDSREVAAKDLLSERKYGKGAGIEGLRPSFIVPWKAKNVLIEGITLRNIPLWAIRAVYTENIIVRDINVWGVAGRHGLEKVSRNNAGICLDSCKNGLIEYVHVETTDDAIVVRSGLNEDGLKINIPSENIVVRHYKATDIDTGSGGIVFGSETSGGVRNVYVHDAVYERSDRGIRFKSTRGRGNVVENIWIDNIRMHDIHMYAISFNTSYPGAVRGPAPLFRNIHIKNVEIDQAANGIVMGGLPEMWLENYTFKNIKITNARTGVEMSNVRNLSMENVEVQSTKGPAVSLNNCRYIVFKDTKFQGQEGPLRIRGSQTDVVDVDVPADQIQFEKDASVSVLVRPDHEKIENQTFDVTKYGARGDGKQLCTEAIQKAIDACHQAGGGRVIVPEGTFLCGGLILKSNVNLHLVEGARLLGSANLDDYPIMIPEFKSRTNDLYVNRSILYAEKAKHVSVTGPGIIDGNGRDPAFSRTYPQKNRPFVARFVECENLTIRDVAMEESANWTCHLLGCYEVTVDGLKIRNSVRANRDGLDIDSSRNVTVTNCRIFSQDDAIVLKSTSYQPAKQILIENCEVSSHASGIKMGTESSGGFEDVIIRHCKIRDVPNLSGLGFMIVDGGSMRNIQVYDIEMDRVKVPIFLRLGKRSRPVAAGDPVPGAGVIEHVYFSNITAKHAGYPCTITGLHERKIDNVSFRNISLQFDYEGQTDPVAYNQVPFNEQSYPHGKLYGDSVPASAFYFRNVSNLTLRDVNVEMTGRNRRVPFVLDRVKTAEVCDFNVKDSIDPETFIYLRNVENVSVEGRNRKDGLAYVISEKDNCRDLRLKDTLDDGTLGYREVESLPDKTYEDVSAHSRVKFEGDTYRGKSCIKLDQKNMFTLDTKKGSPCQILFLAASEGDNPQKVELLINGKPYSTDVNSREWGWSSVYILEPLETSTVTVELLGKPQFCVRIAEAALIRKAMTD